MNNPCPWHRPVLWRKIGYNAWTNFAEAQIKAGNRQKYCPKCRHYLFPCEWGEPDEQEINNLREFKRLTNKRRKLSEPGN